jgi:hypothetical protein
MADFQGENPKLGLLVLTRTHSKIRNLSVKHTKKQNLQRELFILFGKRCVRSFVM